MTAPLRALFVKDRLGWPRASGHDVHTFHLMQALAAAGHQVALATMDRPAPEATANGGFAAQYCFADASPAVPPADAVPVHLSKSQDKFRDYWGVSLDKVRWVAAAAKQFDANAVVVSGLAVLPYLGAVTGATRVWYAADEWVWHHWSQVRALQPGTWGEFKAGVIKGLYERAYRSLTDRVWVVSREDATAFRWVTGTRAADVLPNGVDTTHFAPGDEAAEPNTAAFWGRLDFGPNAQALEWFLGSVWPRVRAVVPAARFDVFGFQPTPAVRALTAQPGVTLTADLPDLRPELRKRAVAVLPFVSGGGIKNKLLEAAALGMPVACTPRTLTATVGTCPAVVAGDPAGLAAAVADLFRDAAKRAAVGAALRQWAVTHHTWAAAAATAAAALRRGAA